MPESMRNIGALALTLFLGLAMTGCSEQASKASEPQAGTAPAASASGAGGAGGSYEGFIDEVSCQVVRGWAWNPSQPDAPLTIELYDGDRLLRTIVADQFRPDLRDGGKGNGRHVFHEQAPAELKDGKPHTIRAVVKDSGIALKPSAGVSATVTCASPSGT
jgi:hypothetical protein